MYEKVFTWQSEIWFFLFEYNFPLYIIYNNVYREKNCFKLKNKLENVLPVQLYFVHLHCKTDKTKDYD